MHVSYSPIPSPTPFLTLTCLRSDLPISLPVRFPRSYPKTPTNLYQKRQPPPIPPSKPRNRCLTKIEKWLSEYPPCSPSCQNTSNPKSKISPHPRSHELNRFQPPSMPPPHNSLSNSRPRQGRYGINTASQSQDRALKAIYLDRSMTTAQASLST